MNKHIVTIRQAAQEWVNGFNAIPHSLLELAYGGDNIDKVYNITPKVKGDSVYVYGGRNGENGEIVSVNYKKETARVKIYGEDKPITVALDDLELTEGYGGFFPAWGTLWTFNDSCDEWWLDEEENRVKMAECGFVIFESDELGYFFGIDGAGYDFYEQHWIPLYKAVGLQWHEETA